MVPTKRSAIALARGARTGVLMIWMVQRGETSRRCHRKMVAGRAGRRLTAGRRIAPETDNGRRSGGSLTATAPAAGPPMSASRCFVIRGG